MERRWTPNQLLIANVATLVVVLVILAVQLPAVLAAAFGAGLGTDEPTEVVTRLIEFHDEWMETDQRRFNGRSFFFMPPRKLPPRQPPPVEKDTTPAEHPEPVEPPPSLVYTGPSVIGILGDEVWFRAPRAGSLGLRIRVGQEPQEGITVLATNPPWSVTLGYQRGEYDIDVWKNDFPGIERSAPPRRPIPGLIEPAPETPTPTETPSESADDAEAAAVLDAQPGGIGEKDQPGSPTADAEATATEPEGDSGHPDPKPAEPTGPAKKESTTDDGATGTVPEGDADRPEPEPAKMAEEESTADDEDGSPSDPQEQ